jgi:hypothetical protein
MSSLSEIIFPVGAVLLGAFAVSKLLSGNQPTCSGNVSQTCLGPLCWATCQATGGSSGTQNNGQQNPNNGGIGSPSGPGGFGGNTNTGTPCSQVDPLLWWTHPECWSGGSVGW